jgi:DtxR family transcriptional regulator, manganese transport regulator
MSLRSSRSISARSGSARGARSGASSSAERHARTRRAHASELAEDYVEVIAELIASKGEARVVDIAAAMGVSHVTVVRTVARLAKADLVIARPYRAIFLTSAGEALASQSKRRHEVVVSFLKSLGVSARAAEADAEGIEHHVSDETLRAMERFAQHRG